VKYVHNSCKGVVQIIEQCYVAERGEAREPFGSVSYTQFGALS